MGNVISLDSKRHGIIILIVLLLFAVPSLAMLFPTSVTPASAPPDVFSAERAMKHLSAISQEPHAQGSPSQAKVRDYLVRQLVDSGLEVEIQQISDLSNVVSRIRGSDSSGAIVILAHYDTASISPGAGDNGSGVAALVEIARALAVGPVMKNDVIILFDDGEEGPIIFAGTKAFVSGHPWMKDVQVAISLDTAVAGPISTNEVGPKNNGWLVQAMSRAYIGGAWTSFSGGGQYDSTAFSDAGILVLALEDNYPFRQKHTAEDTLEIIRPASVQQMGSQTLAIVRELGRLDLADPWDDQETFFSLPCTGLAHYPQAWSLPLAIVAALLLLISLVLALKHHLSSLRGLAAALGVILLMAAVAGIGISALKPLLPKMFGWQTWQWGEWPEVIPPYGGLVVAGLDLIVLGMVMAGYILLRRKSARMDFSLAGLVPFCILALLMAAIEPRTAYAFIWPIMLGAFGWITVSVFGRKSNRWLEDFAATLPAVALVVLLLPFLPGIVMADGMKSIEILAAVEVLLLSVTLPALDGLLVRYAKRA